MADNITVDTITGSPVVATDDDGTAQHPYVKVEFGADNTQTPVDATNPLPVELFDAGGASVVHDEDSPAAPGDPGLMMLAVRNDTLASLVGTDNDYAPLQVNGSGALYVSVDGTVTVGAHAVTNAGTFAVQVDGDALTALQLIDNIVLTEDAAHSTGASGVMSLGVRNDELAALAGTDGDYAPLQVDPAGALFVTEASAAVVNSQVISASTSGNNTLLAAQGVGNKIRVHSLFYTTNGTVTVRFEDGAAGTALSGQMDHIAYTGMVLPYNPKGWFETSADTLLNLELSAAVEVAGGFTYSVVT